MNSSQPETELIRLREWHIEPEFPTMDALAIVATMTPNDDVYHVSMVTEGMAKKK